MLILEDWAHEVSFDPEEVDKERGVVLEEWRLGLGADARMRDAQLPVLLKGSRYAERSPDRQPEIIRNVSHARLKQFYTDWYRPDLMAVIAVGDFDPAAVEASIKAHFGADSRRRRRRGRGRVYTVPDTRERCTRVATDREATSTTVGVFGKDAGARPAHRRRVPAADGGAAVQRPAVGSAGRDRAARLARRSSRRETHADCSCASAEVTTLTALVADGGAERGLAALFAEAERVARDRLHRHRARAEKLDSQRYLEQALVEKDKSPSAPLADEFIRNFMDDEPIPGIVYEQACRSGSCRSITLAEVNAVGQTWIPDGNRVVVVSAPERAGLTRADGGGARGGRQGSRRRERSAAYVDGVNTQPLLDPLPTPGTITRPRRATAIGVTEWRLSNGVRVVLEADDVQGGRDAVPGRQPGRHVARDATRISSRPRRPTRWSRKAGWARCLAGRPEQGAGRRQHGVVRADIDDTEEGLRGGAARRDLETMFQLIYLTFTAPRADPEAFERLDQPAEGGARATQATSRKPRSEDALDLRADAESPARAAADAGARRSDEPRQVAGVLQGPLRRRQRLHVRVRRQLRPRRR